MSGGVAKIFDGGKSHEEQSCPKSKLARRKVTPETESEKTIKAQKYKRAKKPKVIRIKTAIKKAPDGRKNSTSRGL